MTSGIPASAFETGQFSLAVCAAAANASASRPGTVPRTVSAPRMIPSPGWKVTVADVSSFFTASPQGCAIWGKRFHSYQQYLNGLPTLWKGAPQNSQTAEILRKQYPNLGLVVDEMPSAIRDVVVTQTSPKHPFMIDDASGALYVNAAHEYVRGPRDSLKRSLAYSEFLRLPRIKVSYTGVDYIERQMSARAI